MSEEKQEKSDIYEVVITVVIGLSTVLGALCAYYAALWGGEQQTKYTLAVNEQSVANTQYLEVLNDYTKFEMDQFKDDIIYAEWKQNMQSGDPDAEYYFSKLSEGLQKDLTEDASDVSSYDKEQEVRLADILQRFDASDSLSQQSKVIMEEGQKANEYGDKFTFATVLFTIVLFFGGLAALKTKNRMKVIYLSMAALVFVLACVSFFQAPLPG